VVGWLGFVSLCWAAHGAGGGFCGAKVVVEWVVGAAHKDRGWEERVGGGWKGGWSGGKEPYP